MKIDASLPRATWKHGRTGYRKKRLNTLKDSLDQDSLLEEIESNSNNKKEKINNSLKIDSIHTNIINNNGIIASVYTTSDENNHK